MLLFVGGTYLLHNNMRDNVLQLFYLLKAERQTQRWTGRDREREVGDRQRERERERERERDWYGTETYNF